MREEIKKALGGIRLNAGGGFPSLDEAADAVMALLAEQPVVEIEEGRVLGGNFGHPEEYPESGPSPIQGVWGNDGTADASAHLDDGRYALVRLVSR